MYFILFILPFLEKEKGFQKSWGKKQLPLFLMFIKGGKFDKENFSKR